MRSDLKTNRIGEIRKNNSGHTMKIIEYFGASKITVEFNDGCTKQTRYKAFKNGEVRNPNSKNGKLGNSKMVSEKNVTKLSYIKWRDMLTRCYGKNQKKAYNNCSVCDEWLIYENFEKWYDKNYYECGEEIMTLDKDILFKGNKIYSPKTCIFVPHSINSSFNMCKERRGNLPIGVCLYRDGRYTTSINKHGKQNWIGYFNTKEEAFDAYKNTKESYIKQVADEYKSKYPNFPQKLYDAMYSWKISIND